MADTFKIVEVDGIKLHVRYPSGKDLQDAQVIYAGQMQRCLSQKIAVKAKLLSSLKENGIWDDEKDSKEKELSRFISDGLDRLKDGGIPLKEAEKLAREVFEKRMALRDLLFERNSYERNCAESISEDSQFNFLVSACVFDENNAKPYFKDLNDYMSNMTKPHAQAAAKKLFSMVYNYEENAEDSLPEVQFLKKFKFVDKNGYELRRNEKGERVDKDGKKIDSEGYYLNDKNQRVDSDGRLLDADNKPIYKNAPFLDEDGNPVVVDTED